MWLTPRHRLVALKTAAVLWLPAAALGCGWNQLAENPTATYVGRAACAQCHAHEVKAYNGSDHDRAMEPADAKSVLGDFNNVRFIHNRITTTFFRQGEEYWVRTDGPNGKLQDYRVAYTFGVDPLQQYLIKFSDGRLQALDIAWDSRLKAQGGQRWFHLHPDGKVDYRDVLHWAGPALNWNHMCAECHSTGLRKNYRADRNRFSTEWSEIDVSCEACHGPASRHIAWARDSHKADDPGKGFEARLTTGKGRWTFEAGMSTAQLRQPWDTTALVETCGRCHARRTPISEDWRPGRPLAQTHRVDLLEEGLYHADGQILDEVYEYGSFLQSRMYASGVVCTDCHDPHSTRLRAKGNAVCTACHQHAVFDTPAHHHHRQQSEAARCVSCHMAARLYMVVDARRDHSFRVPRPDLSVTLGTPNACTDCHRSRSAEWAHAAVVKRHGPTGTGRPGWAHAIAAGRGWQAGADKLLAKVVDQPAVPPIVRASAIALLARFPYAIRAEFVERTLHDRDPFVRRAGLGLLFVLEPARRWQIGSPLLADPTRTVRLEAVNALAELPSVLSLPQAQRAPFDRAVKEFRAAQALNADRADAWLNLGALEVRLGSPERAEAAYERAIGLQPSFMPAYVNLADLYREQGREEVGERILRQALARQPEVAEVHHALGLLLVRQKRMPEALTELATAARLGREVPRFAYVHAIALNSTGQHAKALALLGEAQRRFPGERNILVALVQLSRQAGNGEAAARWAEKLRDLDCAGR